jgi:hypothetical protein
MESSPLNNTTTIDHQKIFFVHFPPNRSFPLTATMLQFDAPSMFSRVFLSNSTFHETTSRKITITDKSPELFTFIIDYLRGYTIFPLNESAVPPRWLPLHKTYENLRRDASYYGLLRLETECGVWLKRLLNPSDKQAVLQLDFAPFVGFPRPVSPTASPGTTNPLTAEMILDCHLADISRLRKRWLKPGLKTLTYGPMPWKQIFDQIKNAEDRDGVLQVDGSAIVDVASLFIKPPRAQDDNIDDRKIELAKIHISKEITQLILDGVRPAGMSAHLTIRFHATDVASMLAFTLSSESIRQVFPITRSTDAPLIGEGKFIFKDKLQREGYLSLRSVARAESPTTTATYLDDEKGFPLDTGAKTVLEVDGKEIEWRTLCQWSKMSEPLHMSSQLGDDVFDMPMSPELAVCEKFFGGSRITTDQGSIPIVYPLSMSLTQASVFGSVSFVFARSKYENYVVPQLISVKGISEGTWERKRPIWEGDCDRERVPQKKRKTNKDGDDMESIEGTENRIGGGE